MRRKIALILLCCGLIACKNRNAELKQTGDQDVVLQVVNIRSNDTATTAYKAKITLVGEKMKERLTPDARRSMSFNTDSAFYLSGPSGRVYPLIVQPVANGVSNTFEYLIDFEKKATDMNTSMVYHDKYLTRKDYRLKLN